MQFRSITPAEVTAFATIAGDAERSAALEEQLRGYIAGGYGDPGWLWIAEEGGQIVGRLAYTGNRGQGFPSYVVWMDVASGQDETTVAG